MRDTHEELLKRTLDTTDLVAMATENVIVEIVSPVVAVVYLRDHRLGYTDRIGHLATYVVANRSSAKTRWAVDPITERQVLWPGMNPTPSTVMNWLHDHGLALLRDIAMSLGYEVRTGHSDLLRWLIGYHYQVDFCTTNPKAFEAVSGFRVDLDSSLKIWRRRIAILAVGAQERGWPESRKDGQSAKEVMTVRDRIQLRLDGRLSLTPVDGTTYTEDEAADVAAEETEQPQTEAEADEAEEDTSMAENTATTTPTETKVIVKKKTTGTPTAPATAKTSVSSVTGRKAKKAPTAKAKKRAASNGDASEYSKKLLQAQKALKEGQTVTYHGRREGFDGKSGKVVSFNSNGGVMIQIGETKMEVSPFSIMKKEKAEKK